MYFLVECVVCIGLALGVTSCLFGLCIVFLLLQEGWRQLRSFVDRTINSSRPLEMQALILRPVPAAWNDKPATGNISTLAL
jgi:hypothetical protein